MTKKLSGLPKKWFGKRGTVLVAVSLVLAAIGAVALGMSAMMLYKVANVDPGSMAAFYAADACIKAADNLEPASNMDASCVAGAAIDFTNSTNSSVLCDVDTGATGTVLPVGSSCSCTAEIANINATTGYYDIVAKGICNASNAVGRNYENSYSVSIVKTIKGCQTCAQLCPTTLATGANCVSGCGDSCEQCCAPGAVSPACQTTCQN